MHRSTRTVLLFALLTVMGCYRGEATHDQAADSSVPLYDNLGSYHHAITTSVPLAQQYFDQGLRLYYAFNHAESIRAFDEAARLDPRCAMCHWGSALAYGPNINLPMDPAAVEPAMAALRRAQAVQEHASPRELALIGALAARYSADLAPDRAALDSAYARAMKQVAELYPDDVEARTLYAEALMDLSPWQYWNRDGTPRPDTPVLLAMLEGVLETDSSHPGANHLYIHAVEAVAPERAVPMAERLAALMPGAGHIVHMPGHIYIRVGRYVDAIRANEHAVHADEAYIRDHNPGVGVYTVGYYPHNYDFLSFAASMIGRSRQSLDAADRMASLVSEELLRAPGMTVLQNHRSRALQMRVRFAHWDEITQTAEPPADLPYARAIWHYAQGRALAARGDADAASAQLSSLRRLAADPSLADATVEFNAASDILAVAVDVLGGMIAEARRNYPEAIRLLRSATEREDALIYGEPPEWSVPVRQELGAVLLGAGRALEAEAAFRADLKRFPANGWSLDGLARSLEAQGRQADVAAVRRTFDDVWSNADMRIAGARVR